MRCFRLPGFFRKRVEPELYYVCFAACRYSVVAQIVESGDEQDVQTQDDKIIFLEKLPKCCPQCGKKLKARKVPVHIVY